MNTDQLTPTTVDFVFAVGGTQLDRIWENSPSTHGLGGRYRLTIQPHVAKVVWRHCGHDKCGPHASVTVTGQRYKMDGTVGTTNPYSCRTYYNMDNDIPNWVSVLIEQTRPAAMMAMVTYTAAAR